MGAVDLGAVDVGAPSVVGRGSDRRWPGLGGPLGQSHRSTGGPPCPVVCWRLWVPFNPDEDEPWAW